VTVCLEIPRERYGLIVELAERMHARRFSFGKTALQKLVYLLQKLHGINCGYKFTLYTYGPFSSLLLSDLDSVGAFRGVDVRFYGPAGYQIDPGPMSASVRQHAERFIEEYSKQIDEVVDTFGKLSAKQLELRATVVYAEHALKKVEGKAPTPKELVSAVRDLKPYFSEDEVRGAISELDSNGYTQLFKRPAATLRPSTARSNSTFKGGKGIAKRGTSVHVALSPAHSGRFIAKEADTTKAQARPANQAATISKAVNTAKQNKSQVVIHGRDGTVRNRDTYSKDPHPPRDKKH
jgi:uncharacterized protein YwgA